MTTPTDTPTPAPRVPAVTLSDAQLRQAIVDQEQVIREANAYAVELANQVAYRSRPELPQAENFAMVNGHPRAVGVIEALTHVAPAEARRRIALGAKTQDRQLFGQVLEPVYPRIARILATGEIAPEVALLIITMLDTSATNHAIPEQIAVAEEALSVCAPTLCLDQVKTQVEAWRAVIDPDGAEPREDRAHQKRSLRFGRSHDGLTEIILLAPTIDIAIIKAAFVEADKLTTKPRFLSEEDEATAETTVGPHGEPQQIFRDPRSFAQRHYDLFVGYFRAGIRSKDTGGSGCRSLSTVNVVVTAKDLESGIGVGWAEGIAEGLSITAIRRLVDSDGAHPVIFGKDGKIIAYGDRTRGFSDKQRRAIATRDGQYCSCGCGTPASACDAHHVIPYRDGGVTEVDNGILLCPPHHRWLTESGFQIKMIRGRPQVLAPPHLDPNQTWRPMGTSRPELKDTLGNVDW